MWGDGLAQWLERWTRDPKVEGSNPARSARKTLSFSESKRLCRLAVGVPNLHVYTQAYERPRAHVKNSVVHVRVWWIMETKITSTHLYPRRWNVAAQVTEE